MMRRTTGFLVTLALALLTTPLATKAQQARRMARIGYLSAASATGTGEFVMDRRERLASVLVHAAIPTIGIASTPFGFRIARAGERVP